MLSSFEAALAAGATAILLHPPPPLAGVLIGTERECQQRDSLADGQADTVDAVVVDAVAAVDAVALVHAVDFGCC